MSNREKFEQMIRSPDWAMVADVLGEVPSALRSLYESDIVVQSYWYVPSEDDKEPGYEIAEFEALRPEWRETMWPELEDGCLTFAGDGFGNQLFIRAQSGPDWPVHFFSHENGQSTLVTKSLVAFCNRLRKIDEGDE